MIATGGSGVEVDGSGRRSRAWRQLVMDDLHHHLAGGSPTHTVGGPIACSRTFSVKLRTTSSETSPPAARGGPRASRASDIGFRPATRPASAESSMHQAFRQIGRTLKFSSCWPHPEEQAQPASRRVAIPFKPILRDAASRLLRMRPLLLYLCSLPTRLRARRCYRRHTRESGYPVRCSSSAQASCSGYWITRFRGD